MTGWIPWLVALRQVFETASEESVLRQEMWDVAFRRSSCPGFPRLKTQFQQLWMDLQGITKSAVGSMSDEVKQGFADMKSSIGELSSQTSSLGNAIRSLGDTFNSDFLKNLGSGISKVGDTVNTVIGLVDRLGSMKNTIGNLGSTMQNLGNALGTENGGGLLSNIGSFLSKIGSADGSQIVLKFGNLISGLTSKMGGLGEGISGIISKLGSLGSNVLYFGRFSEEKGIGTLIKVCKELPDVQFIFAGTGPLEEMMNGVKNIKNVGFQKGEVLEKLIREAQFSIYPSEWYENCPFSVMESQMYGTLVLGANIGGMGDVNGSIKKH